MSTMRTHVIIPTEVVRDIDKLVGKRGRSKFLTKAAEEKLKKERFHSALEKVAGSLKDVDIPGWETSESAAKWVHDSRRMDQENFDREN